MEKDAKYWQGQISSAKSDNKTFLSDAKDCIEAYQKEKSYNIFYSNVNVLEANLLSNSPKPDIQRRFLKKLESQKLKYNTYLEVAKVSEGCISYYSDIANLQKSFKKTIHNSVKVGRGVDWVEYQPVIETSQEGGKVVADRKLLVKSLSYKEFMCSSAEDWDSVWWVARRHLLSKEDLRKRFNYDAKEDELNFEGVKETSQKRAEIWEVWDKTEKKRHFVLNSGIENKYLESQDDPYKLEEFFPCSAIAWLTDKESVIPIPEYKVYRKKAIELNYVSKKSDDLEEAVKLVVITANQNKDITSEISDAKNGAVISINMADPTGNKNVANMLTAIPVDGALNVMAHCETKKEELKRDIYDITGISDLMRGVSESNETATAQKIKGVFGSLRFQNRQKTVQQHIKKIYSIMTEIICEHWDEKTMSEITCTYLPTAEEKQDIMMREQQFQVMSQQNPQLVESGQIQPVAEEEKNKLEQPTWNDIISIMRNDKLRNFTIDIETTSTVFDDKVAQEQAINSLMQTYVNVVSQGITLQDENLIKGFIPMAKATLTNNKAGRAMTMQIEEALEGAYKSIEETKKQPPQPSPDMLKIQLEQQKMQMEQQYKAQEMQIRQAELQNKSRELAIKEQEVFGKGEIERQKTLQDGAFKQAEMGDKSRQTDIKQQEANRKEKELNIETELSVAGFQAGQKIDTNINTQ